MMWELKDSCREDKNVDSFWAAVLKGSITATMLRIVAC